jgi:hypothetical protein
VIDDTKIYKVIAEYISPYQDSILFHKSESVQVGTDSSDDPLCEWKNWVRCIGDGGKEAWCPRSNGSGRYLEISGKTGIFLRDYDAKELTVHIGELISVSELLNGFGFAAKVHGECGWVPLKCLEELV